jgi:hypothetical protein
MNLKDKEELEQSFVDATVIELTSNKQKLWLFLKSAIGIGPIIGIEPGEVILLYLGRDILKIFAPSSNTIKCYEDLLIIENEFNDPKMDTTGLKVLKIAAELSKFLLVASLNAEINKRIHELEVVKDVII